MMMTLLVDDDERRSYVLVSVSNSYDALACLQKYCRFLHQQSLVTSDARGFLDLISPSRCSARCWMICQEKRLGRRE